MSDANGPLVPQGQGTNLQSETSVPERAKDEAAAVGHTATEAAKDVGHVAKDEATSVVEEGKDQIRDLYEQTRSELADEATKQQERVAAGLQTVGNDLGSMARSADDAGLAREFVREASQRVDRVASWLSEREPGDVLNEVKAFARRQPGVFIGLAAVAGVVAGRLTRALASSAHDQQDAGDTTGTRSREAPTDADRPLRTVPAGGTLPTASGAAAEVGAHGTARPAPGPEAGSVTSGDTRSGREASSGLSREEGEDERPYTL